jgi:hypothetical protein
VLIVTWLGLTIAIVRQFRKRISRQEELSTEASP